MQPLEQFLNTLLDKWERMLTKLSAQWELHTNRRTILVFLMGSTIVLYAYVTLFDAPANFPVGTLVTVEEGATLSDVASQFEEMDVVRSGVALKGVVFLLGHDRDIHAGDYLFVQPKDVLSVARAISMGVFGLEPTRIRVPEGATVAGMARIFAPQLQRFDKERFIADALPYEGHLFPDTYFFMPNATDKTVIETLRNNFEEKVKVLEEQYGTSTRSRKEIVTMASILEREAKNHQDRRMIAGVLWKRLDRGMALQVDAVFLYTLGRTPFDLTMKDLVSDSPYNTYRYKGLPPTPIGSPSLDSLTAALTPIKNDFLFYLADRNYVTHFSKTYEEHLAKKRRYLGT